MRDQPIKVCDDANEWPPYSYFERSNGVTSRHLVGYSVEVLDIILRRHRIAYSIELLPWKRCLREVQEGGNFHMLLNAVSTPERESVYLFSQPYHQTQSSYFYVRKKYPQGLALRSIADLRGRVLGGLSGYAYPLLEPAMLETMQRTRTYKSLFAMLKLGRVDVLVVSYEPMLGLALIDGFDPLSDPDLGHALMPYLRPAEFRMLFTAKPPVGAALRELVDLELASMEKTGELTRLRAKYLQRR